MEKKLTHYGIVGKSGSGKTSLIVKLIKKLQIKGYSVSTVKHSQGEFRIDTEGKDSWKHEEAGASPVVFSTTKETSFVCDGEMSLDSILSIIDDIDSPDIVLIEGMKEAEIPKISMGDGFDASIIYEDNIQEILDFLEEEIEVDKVWNELPGLNCKKCGFGSCRELAEAVYKGQAEKEDCVNYGLTIDLKVNDKDIYLTDFPAKMIKNGLSGLLTSLKGVDEVKDVEIKYSMEESVLPEDES